MCCWTCSHRAAALEMVEIPCLAQGQEGKNQTGRKPQLQQGATLSFNTAVTLVKPLIHMLWTELNTARTDWGVESGGVCHSTHHTSCPLSHTFTHSDSETWRSLLEKWPPLMQWEICGRKVIQASVCVVRAMGRSVCGCLLCSGRRDKSICMELKVVVRLKKEAQTCHRRRISRHEQDVKSWERGTVSELRHHWGYTDFFFLSCTENGSRKCIVL